MFESSNEIIKRFTIGKDDKKKDFLTRNNSNFVYSLNLLRHNIDNFEEKKYLMDEIFTKELKQLELDNIIYVHDKQLAPYCNSLSCLTVAKIGVPTLAKNMRASKPTKKINTLFRQFSNIVVLLSQQTSGAVMLSQLTTVIASYLYYLEKEENKKISNEDLKDAFYNFIWELNLPLRSGSQSSFSNCTLEFEKCSPEVKDEYITIGGEIMLEKYKDVPSKYFDFVNKAFIDAMAKGGGDGIPFTFPLISISIDDNFNHKNKMYLYLLDKMYNWGGCYFENFTNKPFTDDYYRKINPMIKPRNPETSRSLCCRLQIDLETLSKAGTGIFGSSSGNVGAVQVLNINLNRVLMENKYEFNGSKEKLKERLNYLLNVLEENHQLKRKWILNNKELYPTFFAYNENLDNYFNVFAVSAMHEGLINIGYKDGLKNKKGKVFAHEIMQYIHEVLNGFIIRDKVAVGVEFAPNENAGVKLSRADLEYGKKIGIDVFVQGDVKSEETYTTSGCMLPFSEEDFLEQIENASEFQAYGTSGSILHQFLETKVSPEKLSKHIQNIFKKPISYITLSPTITSCMSCKQQLVGIDAKNLEKCPVCGSSDLATFSRVIGYTKMISRGNVKTDNTGKYKGDFNFWSASRRRDWNIRKRLQEVDLID